MNAGRTQGLFLRWALLLHRCFLLAGLLLMLCHLHAQTLRIALPEDDYPPYYYTENEQLSGVSVEILTAISQQLHVTLEWQRLPWSRVLHHIDTGRADIVPVLYKTSEREQRFRYSTSSYMIDPIVLLCAQPCPVQFNGDLASLQPYGVAIVRHYSYGVELDRAMPPISAMVGSDMMLFKLLLAKRITLAMVSAHSAQHSPVLQQSAARVVLLQPPLAYVEVYFGFNRSANLTDALLTQFDQALATYKASGQYHQLMAKYQLLAGSTQ